MSARERILAVLLAAAGLTITVGVGLFEVRAALVVGGLLFGMWAWFVLAEVAE